jgi:ABC-type transport system substrate-binding protein
MLIGSRRRIVPFAAVLVATLLVVACGGNNDDDADDDESTGTTEARVIESEGEVTPGGDIIFGVEAETTGWDPALDRWAVSGHQVAQTVFDTLATYNADGEAVPYLAESFEASEDWTEWTITLREGIEFHDGTPLTSEAVVRTFEEHRESALTSPTVRTMETVEAVDDLTARVTFTDPWASFPVILTGQIGYIASPTQYDSGDEARRDSPIGTGPFVFEEWIPDDHFSASRNANYWRTDADGNALPYLDSVEVRPMVEANQRLAAFQAGDIQMMHTTDTDIILSLRDMFENDEAQVVEDNSIGEESFIQLNTLQPPLDDVRVRQALAYATDRESYAEVIDDGIRQVASGPFIDSSPWYSEEAAAAYPSFDQAQAQALVDEYEAEVGPIEFAVSLTPTEQNRAAVGFLQELWGQVGIDVTTNEVQQDQLIFQALGGEFAGNQWRQFGSPDPDGEYVWWDIENANPIGEASLNFARIRNDDLTAAMNAGRATDVFEDRKAAYDDAQAVINEQVPYIWLTHTLWAIGADTDVRNIAVSTLPDGEPALGFGTGFAGAIRMTEVWIEQ